MRTGIPSAIPGIFLWSFRQKDIQLYFVVDFNTSFTPTLTGVMSYNQMGSSTLSLVPGSVRFRLGRDIFVGTLIWARGTSSLAFDTTLKCFTFGTAV